MSASTLTLLIATGGLIVLLALLILFNENYNATKGYKLRTLERERSQLLLTEELLMTHIAKAQALETLLQDPHILGMVEVERVGYVEADRAVASRGE